MHPNEEFIRKGYAAFAAGDLDTVRSMFADDIVWHIGGHTALSGDHSGIDAVFAFFGQMFEMSGATFSVEVLDALADDGTVVVFAKERAQRDGRTLDSTEVHVWRIVDGKAVDFRGLPYDFEASQAFWS